MERKKSLYSFSPIFFPTSCSVLIFKIESKSYIGIPCFRAVSNYNVYLIAALHRRDGKTQESGGSLLGAYLIWKCENKKQGIFGVLTCGNDGS